MLSACKSKALYKTRTKSKVIKENKFLLKTIIQKIERRAKYRKVETDIKKKCRGKKLNGNKKLKERLEHASRK